MRILVMLHFPLQPAHGYIFSCAVSFSDAPVLSVMNACSRCEPQSVSPYVSLSKELKDWPLSSFGDCLGLASVFLWGLPPPSRPDQLWWAGALPLSPSTSDKSLTSLCLSSLNGEIGGVLADCGKGPSQSLKHLTEWSSTRKRYFVWGFGVVVGLVHIETKYHSVVVIF